MQRWPYGLRDHPGVLFAAVVALVVVVLGLGYLTARVGSRLTHAYANRHPASDMP